MGEVVPFVTLIAVIIGIIVNISNMADKKAAKAASDARLEVKLDNIYNKVNSIEKKQTTIEGTLQNHEGRIIKVEESTKSAHHRIDELIK